MANQREKILVVESDPIVADLIARQALGGQDFDVKHAAEANTAIQEAQSFEPDVVIANLDLPGLSGKDLIAALSFQNVRIPVIVISSQGQEKDVIRAFRLGASDFISMPIRETEVVSAVERALKSVRASKERELLAGRLQNANRELKTRVEQLTSLFAIGKAVTSVADQKKLFQQIVKESVNITQADFGWFLNRDERSGEYYLRAQVNLPKSLRQHLNKPWDDGISSLVARSGETFSIHGKSMDRFMLNSLGKSALAVPVKVRGEIVGLLVVMRKKNREFHAGDQAMLEGVSDYAAISLVNARLFQALDERAASLQASVENTIKQHQIKDEVIDTITQGLPTPLLAAWNELFQLLEGSYGDLNNKQRKSIQLAQQSLSKILQISHTMKFLHDADTPQEAVQLDLGDLIAGAVEHAAPMAEEAKVEISFTLADQSTLVRGDQIQIRSVIDALISNAVKFSRNGGQIEVVLHPPRDGQVTVSVSDTGVGISKANLEKIFIHFSQTEAGEESQVKGLGIGLALVKQVIEDHGGKVWAESKLGEGSHFHFSLPVSQ